MLVAYTLVPWFAVMSAGFCVGPTLLWDPARRRSFLDSTRAAARTQPRARGPDEFTTATRRRGRTAVHVSLVSEHQISAVAAVSADDAGPRFERTGMVGTGPFLSRQPAHRIRQDRRSSRESIGYVPVSPESERYVLAYGPATLEEC